MNKQKLYRLHNYFIAITNVTFYFIFIQHEENKPKEIGVNLLDCNGNGG